MVPNDPLGKHGPKLDDYLSIQPVQKYHPIDATTTIKSDNYHTNFTNYSKSELEPKIANELRMSFETEQFRRKLSEIFPTNRYEIDQTLRSYQFNYDIEYLIDKLIQLID